MELQYTPWKIEQTVFSPEEEKEMERQFSFTNGYLSQGGFFEEYLPQSGPLGTYVRGIASPLPPIGTISVRLHDDRMSLDRWQPTRFYRCLHKDKPQLDRRFTAVSPLGQTLDIQVNRLLLTQHPHVMEIWYRVAATGYEGPISFLSLMGDGTGESDWYPMEQEVTAERAFFHLQSRTADVQAGLMMTMELWKNMTPTAASVIRVEKRHIIGYSMTDEAALGDVFLIRKCVAVSDSLNYPTPSLRSALAGYLEDRKAESEQHTDERMGELYD